MSTPDNGAYVKQTLEEAIRADERRVLLEEISRGLGGLDVVTEDYVGADAFLCVQVFDMLTVLAGEES